VEEERGDAVTIPVLRGRELAPVPEWERLLAEADTMEEIRFALDLRDGVRSAATGSWDETLHPRDDRGRFGQKGEPERGRDYSVAGNESIDPTHGEGGTDGAAMAQVISGWQERTADAGWRDLTFRTADGRNVAVDRHAKERPEWLSGSDFTEQERAEDYKMAIAHEIGERMIEAGVTVEQMERFAEDVQGGRGRSEKGDLDLAPLVWPSLGGRVEMGISGDHAGGQLQPARDDPQYEHLVAEAVASTLIGGWAGSSNDSSPQALAMQDAAARVFGLGENVAGWDMSENVAEGRDYYTEHHGPLFESFLRAQYDNTQEMLEEEGVGTVSLYRGVKLGYSESGESIGDTGGTDYETDLSAAVDSRLAAGETEGQFPDQLVELRPLSSFASAQGSAAAFEGDETGALFTAAVPHERILGTYGTGFGCLGENEVVVIGGGDTRFDVDWQGDASVASANAAHAALEQAFNDEGPDGAGILDAYGPLVLLEPDEYGMPGESSAYLTHPITGEQIMIDGLGDVGPLVQTLDADPIATATHAITEGLKDTPLPAGFSVELQGSTFHVPSSEPKEVILKGPNDTTWDAVSPFAVLGDDLNTFDSESVAIMVARAEADQVGLHVQSALHTQLNTGYEPTNAPGEGSIPVWMQTGQGAGFEGNQLTTGNATYPMVISDVLAYTDPEKGTLQVRFYDKPVERSDPGAPRVVAEIPMAELYAGGMDATIEFAREAARKISEAQAAKRG
jgi:hypothetical protein